MHKSKRHPDGWGTKSKTPVIGAISRKGSVVAQMCDYVDERQAHKFIPNVVDPNVKLVSTDDSGLYRNLSKIGLPHETVDHKAEEYVRGEVHTQNIDNFWSMLKTRHHLHVPQGFGQVPTDVPGGISLPVQRTA